MVILLHVDPIPSLQEGFLSDVVKGGVVGRLAEVESMKPEVEFAYRHTHLILIDLGARQLKNPLHGIKSYQDQTKPSVKEIYFLDDAGKKMAVLASDKVDIVVDAFDRDEASRNNMEVAEIAYSVFDDRGKKLLSSNQCRFDSFTDSIFPPSEENREPLSDLLDLGRAKSQSSGKHWPEFKTDATNPDRSFRYVLTHFSADGTDDCKLRSDENGYLEVVDDVKALNVEVELWDHNGNSYKTSRLLEREQPPAAYVPLD